MPAFDRACLSFYHHFPLQPQEGSVAQVEQVLRKGLDLEKLNAQSGGAPGVQMCACGNVWEQDIKAQPK